MYEWIDKMIENIIYVVFYVVNSDYVLILIVWI